MWCVILCLVWCGWLCCCVYLIWVDVVYDFVFVFECEG